MSVRTTTGSASTQEAVTSSAWMEEAEAARQHLLNIQEIMRRTGDDANYAQLSIAYCAISEMLRAQPRRSSIVGTQVRAGNAAPQQD